MEQVFVEKAETADAAAEEVQSMIRLINNIAKENCLLFHFFQKLQVLLSGRHTQRFVTKVNIVSRFQKLAKCDQLRGQATRQQRAIKVNFQTVENPKELFNCCGHLSKQLTPFII